MKGRFSTIDIAVVVRELTRFLGMRVVNVYDIDNKTYLIKVGKPDEKTFILIESGIRLHSTEFDWPKNPAPSNFSMKLRKHVKGRRLESIRQLGIDRIVDLQFGSNEAAYHVIAELYDRGNIVLTDHEYTILNILRPRTDNSQDVRFAVRETYPVESFKIHQRPSEERLKEILQSGKEGDVLKKFLVPNLDYGPAVIEHALVSAGFPENVKIGGGFQLDADMSKLMSAIDEAESLLSHFLSDPCKGYILQKKDKKSNLKDGEPEEIVLYEEFHPFLFRQHAKKSFSEFESFDKAVDEFYSKLESQKLDLKVIQHEKSAMKKLDNVKKDHEKRIQGLQKEQESDIVKGQLIEMNLELVDQAILIVRSALANQIDWTEIWALVKEAQMNSDPVALAIKGLKLDTNQITVLLKDPFPASDEDDGNGTSSLKPMKIDLDLALSAYGNSRKYFDKKKQAAKKEQKTAEASNKAFKSAEKKTKQSLKEVQTAVSINKTRKTYWFEKFLWFITSENYLVIGGRDQQQNEMIVKRYMKQGDLYVHADLHGASSCVVKNPGGGPVPPKTLNEAGTMAICNSAAWDSKVVTSAWWVYQDQVSKTAPSGEYLTTGSFMIRGKKNYLPPSYLVYGFGFLFKLEDGSVERHVGERKVRTLEEDEMSVADSMATASLAETDDIGLEISEGSSEDEAEDNNREKENNTGEVCEGKEVETKTDSSASNATNQGSSEHGENISNSDDEEGKADEACEDEQETTEREISTDAYQDVVNEAIENSTMDLKAEKSDDMNDENFEFPDTNIKLQHVKGDKYELLRENSETGYSFEPIYLGDSQPVVFGEKVSGKKRLSAKERRDLKKGKRVNITDRCEEEEEEVKACQLPSSRREKDLKDEKTIEHEKDGTPNVSSKASKKDEKDPMPEEPQLSRRQLLKKKKIEQKYGHQDEEERKIKVAILNSAGNHKKKNKKEKEEVQIKPHQKSQPGPHKGQGKSQGPFQGNKGSSENPSDDISLSEGKGKPPNQPTAGAGKSGADSDGEKDEDNVVTDDTGLLNSLTGIPVSEDELLYAIPVCAPYNALLNYKFKVKLLPGSSKKGKAVKTALNMFLHDRTTTNREKDLLKIQKDVELSRNVPGKVKVAAPNLHKNKR